MSDEKTQEEIAEEQENVSSEEDIQQEETAVEEKSELEILQEEVEALKDENSALKDQYLRKSADFENYRKRMVKEKADSIQYANQELIKDLIEVIDNFERAIKSSGDSQDFESFRDGISMIEQQFTQLLANKWGLQKLESVGKEYDPAFHEALMMEESAEVEVDTVLEDFQTGYQLHGRVIRPAKVKVGKPAPEADKDKVEEKKDDASAENE